MQTPSPDLAPPAAAVTPSGERTSFRGRHGELVHSIGALIGRGELPPDAVIVPEELGARYGVSRTVVREALKVLESKGMVAPRPRTGTRVTPERMWDALDSDVIMWQLQGPNSGRHLADLLALRIGVEPIAARSAALGDGRNVALILSEHCDAMEDALSRNDHEGFTHADIAFHSAIVDGSGNAVFQRLTATLAAVLVARKELSLLPDHMDSEVVAQHRLIAAAISNGHHRDAEERVRSLIHVANEEIGMVVEEVNLPVEHDPAS